MVQLGRFRRSIISLFLLVPDTPRPSNLPFYRHDHRQGVADIARDLDNESAPSFCPVQGVATVTNGLQGDGPSFRPFALVYAP